MNVQIREANTSDAGGIFSLIYELAVYEKAAGEVVNTPEQIAHDLKNGYFTAFVAEQEGSIIGLALMYPVYSTWKGLSYYLEDIIVSEPARRKGIGSMLFRRAVAYAAEKKAARLGWQVLDWNESAIAFYREYGPEFDSAWVNCKLTNEQLEQLNSK